MTHTATECQDDFTDQIKEEVMKKVKGEQEKAKQAHRRLSLIVPMDSSGATDESVHAPSKGLNTTRGSTTKMEFTDDLVNKQISPDASGPSAFSFSEQKNMEYMLNRDPMEEFFALTCQSIKLNSPHINTIATIDTKELYLKA